MALILDGTTGVPVTTVTGTLPVANGGSGVTTSTGSGAVVLGTSPTLTTPTFDSASLATISGTAPLYMCRAWVNFNGTGTVAIRASGNVSSITDNGTGNYTVNLTTAMTDANYSAVTCSSSTSNTVNSYIMTSPSQAIVLPTTSAFTIITNTLTNSAQIDATNIMACAFR